MKRPTIEEYQTQVSAYARLALELVRTDTSKLVDLVDKLATLPQPALLSFLEFAGTDAVLGLNDEERLPVWTKLSSFVRKHRQFSDAEWALPADTVDKIDQVVVALTPRDPSVAHRILFSRDTWDLHDNHENWQKNEEQLEERRRTAIQEIYAHGGLSAIIVFAEKVDIPSHVGFALGKVASIDAAGDLIPGFILSLEPKRRELVRGYVWAMFQSAQWGWFDSQDVLRWSDEEIAHVLTYLPFDPETWKRAIELLPDTGKAYWTIVPIASFIRADADYVAFDALMLHGRPRAAVACLAARVHDKQTIDTERAINALLGAVESHEVQAGLDQHTTAMVIKAVQDEGTADTKRLIAVEWAYLQLLEHSHVTSATTLGKALASEPDLFCEMIRLIFRSEKAEENATRPPPTDERRAMAQNAYRLLHTWSEVPGRDPSGGIIGEVLLRWIDRLKTALEQSGHLAVGLQKAGEVLIHAPADPSGLFMHHAVAEVLNRADMDELRRGYKLAVQNARGVHLVDPTGAPEKELARLYNEKAEALENAGFHRVAITFRAISESYKREAEQIVSRYEAERRTLHDE